jgi:hypothetical protein
VGVFRIFDIRTDDSPCGQDMFVKQWRRNVVGAFVVVAVLATMSTNAAVASTTTARPLPVMLVRVPLTSLVYVVARTSCASFCLQLWRTTDSGGAFKLRTLPPVEKSRGAPAGNLDELVFANAEDGYAVTGAKREALYATFNGARSWHKEKDPTTQGLSDLTASSSEVYAVTSHCSKQKNGNTGCTDYRLLRSPLTSMTWSSSPIPNGRKYPWGYLGNVAAYGKDVWLTEGALWSLVATSHNEGATFTTSSSRPLISVTGCYLTSTSSMDLWAQCPTGMQVSFAYSSDGGAHWLTVPTNQFMGTGGGYFDPVSNNLAYLDYGMKQPFDRVTTDGSHITETQVGVLSCSRVNSSIGDLTFTNRLDGLAICYPGDVWADARVDRTTDGGISWRRLELPRA